MPNYITKSPGKILIISDNLGGPIVRFSGKKSVGESLAAALVRDGKTVLSKVSLMIVSLLYADRVNFKWHEANSEYT